MAELVYAYDSKSYGATRVGSIPTRATIWNWIMTKNKNLFAEVAGWYGMTAILLAYVTVSFGVISAEGYIFQLLNLSGAIGIMIISAHKNVKQSLVLNIFWAGVAILALFRILF